MTGPRGQSEFGPVQSSFEFGAPPDRFEALDRCGPNSAAIDFLRGARGWPFPVACLTGPSRSGRTTLAQAFANSQSGRVIAERELARLGLDAVFEPGGALAIDRADHGLPAELFLFLINRVGETGGRLLLTADAPPLAWPVANRDLASRLAATPVVEIERPDEEMIATRLRSLLSRRAQGLPDDVAAYLALRLKRTYADIEACATRLAGRAGPGQGLTVILARSVLEDMYGRERNPGEGIADG